MYSIEHKGTTIFTVEVVDCGIKTWDPSEGVKFIEPPMGKTAKQYMEWKIEHQRKRLFGDFSVPLR